MNVRVYIDGFNLFYGLKRTESCRWLSIVALADHLFPNDTVTTVKYFTARVKAKIDPHAPARQAVYLRAIGDDPRVTITYGRFRIEPVTLPYVKPPKGKSKWARVWRPEEKGSDVNIASHLLVDAFNRRFDIAALITNDSDLKEPIRIVRNPPFGLPVHVFNPTPGKRTKMGATEHIDVTADDYAACILPDPVVLEDGTELTMPEKWKAKKKGPPAGDPMPD